MGTLRSVVVIDLDAVVDRMKAQGVDAYVEQTGGGVATIYAGPAYTDAEGDQRWSVVAGPGWFEGPGWHAPRADLAEFCYGPDDDGESEPTWITKGDEQVVADALVAFVRAAQKEGE